MSLMKLIHLWLVLSLVLAGMLAACSVPAAPVNPDVESTPVPQPPALVSEPDSTFKPANKLAGLYWMVGPKSGLEGDDDGFKKLLQALDDTLNENQYLSGVYIIQHWDLIEPEAGSYQFERLDQVIGIIRQHNLHYKLAITPGIYCPEWLYESGCQAFQTTGSNPAREEIYQQPVKIPLPWDAVFQKYYFRVLQEVARRYAGDDSLYALTLTLANFMSPEWHLPYQKSDREQWAEYAGYAESIVGAWETGIDRFAVLFPGKQLVLEASSWPIGDRDLGGAVIDYGATAYPERFSIQINHLIGRYDMLQNTSYRKLLDSRQKYGESLNIGIQNLKGWEYPAGREIQGSLEMSVYNYIQSGAEYWELWYGDGRNVATCQTLTGLITEANELGLEGYRQKLEREGQYYPPP